MSKEIQLRLCDEIPQIKPEAKIKGKYRKWKYDANYRKSYANICCSTCKNLWVLNNGYKNFYKCNVMGISNSEATDIRLSYVCDYFKGE